MVSSINIKDALALNWPIIDVRSPGEYTKGRIPGSANIPLFSNDERAHVGTVYKQNSKEAAIEVGYTYVNPKLNQFIAESLDVAPNKKVVVHCWRGGMRSQAFAKHLSDNGFKDVRVIEGGYKAFRNHVLSGLEKPYNLKVLGGFTGSGKTHILFELQKQGAQIIDLEGLANHKGSAFGGIGQNEQPSTEQFENTLFYALSHLNENAPIWIEDESNNIGGVKIPKPFFTQMREATLYFIDIPKEERAKHLVKEYAWCESELLADSIYRIAKRLGGLNVKNAIDCLNHKNYFEVALIGLFYYDKAYLKGMQMRSQDKVIRIPIKKINHQKNAKVLIKHVTS